MDDRPQAVLVNQSVFGSLKHPFEQHDGLLDAGLAQLQRFFQQRHRKAVGLVFQRLRAGQRTVAVGVGFDYRQHFAAV